MTVPGRGSSVGSVSASYAMGPEIEFLASSADSRRASCQLMPKERALNTGRLPPGAFPRNSVVK